MNVWFTADWHLGHKQIIKYEDRPFKDVNEMNDTIISKYNSTVKEDDIVFMLGDFALASRQNLYNFVSRLKVKPFLILGNHDGSKTKMAGSGFKVQKHTFRNFDYLILPENSFTDCKEPIILTHVPFKKIYNKNFDFAGWNIHGHIHGGDHKYINYKEKTINVNVEYWNYYPVSLDTILKIVNNIESDYVEIIQETIN